VDGRIDAEYPIQTSVVHWNTNSRTMGGEYGVLVKKYTNPMSFPTIISCRATVAELPSCRYISSCLAHAGPVPAFHSLHVLPIHLGHCPFSGARIYPMKMPSRAI